MKILRVASTHGLALALGFALGVYWLPIHIAPASVDAAEVHQAVGPVLYRGRFQRDLPGSDWLHWGEGELLVGRGHIGLIGELAPGPDYRLYLSPIPVADEGGFLRGRDAMVQVAPIRSFGNFVVAVPESIDLDRYGTVVVWCEAFGQFISSADYRAPEPSR